MKQLRSPGHRTLISVIVAARQAAGLTQRQLAAKLKRSNSFVWKLEAGERHVSRVYHTIERYSLLPIITEHDLPYAVQLGNSVEVRDNCYQILICLLHTSLMSSNHLVDEQRHG